MNTLLSQPHPTEDIEKKKIFSDKISPFSKAFQALKMKIRMNIPFFHHFRVD
jgi:hypothetical protein